MTALRDLCLLFLVCLCQTTNCAEVVFPKLIESRSGGGEIALKITNKITLNLRKSSVFAKELFFRTTDEDGKNIAYHMQGAEAEKDIYHDDEKMASVRVTEDEGLEVEGILGDTLRIKPMAGRERSEDGLMPHMLYEIEAPAHDQRLTPYGLVNSSDLDIEARTRKGSVNEIHPEIFLVVDYTIAKTFQFSVPKVTRYFGILMNAVNLRYKSLTRPKVQLRVVGLTMNKQIKDEPYMENIRGYERYRNILFDETLKKFNKHVERYDYFRKSDVVFLVTAKNMSEWNGNTLETWTGGYAYVAGACTQWKVGMAEERPTSYYGVYVIGHEIAHSLGCAHDGDRNRFSINEIIGSEDCPWDDGYMMSYKMADKNQYRFSHCCEREIRNLCNRPKWACLSKQNYKSVIKASSNLPGESTSFTDFCRGIYLYEPSVTGAEYRGSECKAVCTLHNRNGETWIYTALDGTPCGPNKKKSCIFGECVAARK